MPKSWLIQRKKDKYIVTQKTSYPKKYSLPLVVILRDMLHITDKLIEAKKIIRSGEIEINGRVVKNYKFGVGLLDILHSKKLDKSFIILLTERGHLALKETKENNLKIGKIIGKKILNNNITQLNLFGGKNLITTEKYGVNDSVVIDLKKDNIVKHLPLKKESFVFIIAGKWKGQIAKVQALNKEKAEIKLETKKITNIPIKNLIVMDGGN